MNTIDRSQEIARIKSSIELLEECKDKVFNNDKLDEKTKKDRAEQIDEAIKETYEKARLQYQATKKEVDSATYNEVSEEYKQKYAERLKKKGLTDEQLHQKEQAVVAVVTGGLDEKPKRHRRSTKRATQRADEEGFDYDPSKIQRLENEEELMNKSLAKDKKDLERRRQKSETTMTNKPKNPTTETVVGEIIKEKKVNPRTEISVVAEVVGNEDSPKRENQRVMEKFSEEVGKYEFDTSNIPDFIQYDILPLPSNGECYAHKRNRIPVAYLTAADENIIASPNMYRDGKIIDVILGRKILDKTINVEDLCKGDRDAIVLWLRATGYGPDFPIVAKHPETGKQYPVNIKLDTFKYFPFNLVGDENGYFDYTTENGDILKFKYLSVREEKEIRDNLIARTTDFEKFNITRYLKIISETVNNANFAEGDRRELDDCIADMKDIINADNLDINLDNMYSYTITTQMVKYTMAVNGNYDREYIKSYIENMRAKDAFAYRNYVNDNTPGVNMKIIINVPQSDGGGTFDTFLGIDDYVFGNI